jgi:MATE family multidrug resistance protein
MVTSDAMPRSLWRAELRATLTLAWPLIATNLAQMALTTTDVIVLGRLGPEALAAATLASNLYFAILIFGIGLVSATAPMMAEALGRKRKAVRDIRRTFRQGLWSALIISVPAWLLLWHTEALLLLLRQDARLAADAQVFMRALQWGFLPTLGFIAVRSFVAALERPLWALLLTVATVLFNVLANYVLVFGHFGLPALGMFGSGLATAMSNTLLFVALAVTISVAKRFRRYHLFGRWWRADWPRLQALWRLGLPIGATMAFEITVFNAAVFLIGSFGPIAIAAHAIALQIAGISFMVPLGLSQAATVRVGLAYGARDRAGISRAGWTAFMLALVFNTAMSALLLVAPGTLIGAFLPTDDPANAPVVVLAHGFLFCAALFQIADGVQAVCAGMLRGLQDTRIPMLYAALGYWGFGAPLALLAAFPAGLAGIGVWIGLAGGLALVAVLMTRRWMTRERLGLVPV